MKVVWITNAAAPYRIPLWEAMARHLDLRIGLFESRSSLMRDKHHNRGQDWMATTVPGATVCEYPTLRFKRGQACYYLATSLTAYRDIFWADAIVSTGWESPTYWQILLMAKLLRKPVVGFYESTLETQRFRTGPIAALRKYYFRCLNSVVVPGEAAQAALESMGVPSSHIKVGFNAIDLNSFKGAMHLPSEAGHRFLYVGQLIARKRVDVLLRAFAAIATSNDTLTLVGMGPLRDELARLATDLDIDKHISWISQIENKRLPEIMGRCDTLVLASSEEVWGLVVNEALASRMQVVVTRNCGVVRSVKQMQGVFLARSDATDLGSVMDDARTHYTGPIANPEIWRKTPEGFAEVFLSALRAVTKK